jgi:hypothetical protein
MEIAGRGRGTCVGCRVDLSPVSSLLSETVPETEWAQAWARDGAGRGKRKQKAHPLTLRRGLACRGSLFFVLDLETDLVTFCGPVSDQI